MRVSELIDFLKVHDPDAEVELTFVQSSAEDENTLDVIQCPVSAVIKPPADDDDDTELVWLVAGDDDDVEDFLDTFGDDDDFDED